MQTSSIGKKASGKTFVLCAILLLTILCVLFHKSFDPNQVLFANDAPLGAIKATMNTLPGTFTGNWQDLNWIGGESPSASPNISAFLGTLVSQEVLMKIYAPFTMLLLGLSAWLCFRELGFRPLVCILGGLAAGLNMHAFSIACWGLGTWVISFAMMFLAIAALASQSIRRGWIRGILAGAAVGVGLMEGFDVGAINSLYVAAFGIFVGVAFERFSGKVLAKSAVIVAIVALFAAFTAAHTLSTLIGTQVKGINMAQQDGKSKDERWIWATQWSLPKMELLRVVIPGIFGYRMVDGESQLYEKSYWGAVAQSPGYEQSHQGLARHSGSGEYSGIFVLLIAILATAQSFRKQNNPFSAIEKKFVWFWSATALISLLLALGRHAPFYQFVFALPYFSTIRNPIKFLHPFHVALLILFGYGLESLVRTYFNDAIAKANAARKFTVSAFEKKWTIAGGLLLGGSLLAWMVYVSKKKSLISYLERFDFRSDIAPKIAEFSIGEMGWFVLFFAASIILLLLILRGKFVGKIKLAGILMGALIIFDLAHANVHWIVYQNYKEKYASNPIIDLLREKPYEQRVMVFPFQINDTMSFFQQNVYYLEWLQHLFLYYNIQTLDVAQEPRVPADKEAFLTAFRKAGLSGQVRLWELTNVRYFLGLSGGFADSLNQQIDPAQKRFKVHTAFAVGNSGGAGRYVVQTNLTGQFALIEFTGALPRAKLYSQWQVVTNDPSALEQLVNPAFTPDKTVLVANEIPAAQNLATNSEAGSVQIIAYSPKRVELKAKAEMASVLLLNDKFDPKWKVFVNGQAKPLLRCNFMMRGVQLEKGEHKVEFRFEPPLQTLYVSLTALAAGLGLCAFVAFGRKRKDSGI